MRQRQADDLQRLCETLAEARKRARARAARFGIGVLISEVNPFTGARLIEETD